MIDRNAANRGFTLIETMLAVLLLALLASGAALSFAKPIQRSQAQQAISEICAADRAARLDAARSDRAVQLRFDLRANSIRLYERQTLRSRTMLASLVPMDRILIGGKLIRDQGAAIDFSGSGFSPSYAIHTHDAWIVFHGLTGQTTTTPDEQTARDILDPQSK